MYKNVCRGLFERHKLIFSFMICTSIQASHTHARTHAHTHTHIYTYRKCSSFSLYVNLAYFPPCFEHVNRLSHISCYSPVSYFYQDRTTFTAPLKRLSHINHLSHISSRIMQLSHLHSLHRLSRLFARHRPVSDALSDYPPTPLAPHISHTLFQPQ